VAIWRYLASKPLPMLIRSEDILADSVRSMLDGSIGCGDDIVIIRRIGKLCVGSLLLFQRLYVLCYHPVFRMGVLCVCVYGGEWLPQCAANIT